MDSNTQLALIERMRSRAKTAPSIRVAIVAHQVDNAELFAIVKMFKENGILIWTDALALLPGQDRDFETRQAYEEANFILVLLSRQSVSLESRYQKKIDFAMDAADEMPDDGIKIIPVLLNESDVPRRLKKYEPLKWWEETAKLRLVYSWAIEWQRRTETNSWRTTSFKASWQ